MSDTHGGHGGHGPNPDPMQNLWMAMTGASAGHHHEEVPGVSQEATNVGHEPDRFDARTIIGVPIVVAITLVVTYLIVQGAFAFVNSKTPRQETLPEFNERADRIGTTDGKPLATKDGEQPLKAVPEPNLEYTRQIDRTRKDGSGNDVTDPPFLRSFASKPAGNSPEIYPEDLRADRFIDPTTQRTLTAPAWVVKDKVAAISIDQAIELMTHDDKFKLKTSDKPVTPPAGTIGKPRISTGGTTPPTPDAKKDDGHKH